MFWDEGVISYPYPLRDNLIVRMFLPPDLTRAEVDRLTAFLLTLLKDET